MIRHFEGPTAYAEKTETHYDVYIYRGEERWLLGRVHISEPVRAKKICQLLNDDHAFIQGMLNSFTEVKNWNAQFTNKLEKCPRCKQHTLNRANCGESEIYRSRHVLCVTCWHEEGEEVEREQTNNLPAVLNSYGPPNDVF